jgi:tricorn protease
VVLRRDLPSPLAPESDDEKAPPDPKTAADAKPAGDGKPAGDAKPASPAADRVDLEGIGQRIIALPVAPRAYTSLVPGKSGVVLVGETAAANPTQPGPPQRTLYRFDLATRKEEKVAEGLTSFHVSHNGEKVLLRQQTRWTIVPTMTPPKPGEGALKLDGFEVRVDPRAEWAQMYHEVWRGERDYFYSPQFHGLDLKAAEARYAPYLAAAGFGADVVFGEVLGDSP